MVRVYRLHSVHCTDLAIPSFKLLALYCIECGVKALLMQQYVVEQTEDLPEAAQIGHNAVEGLKLLNAPVSLLKLKDLRMMTTHKQPPQQQVSPATLHQALRYGIPVTCTAESTIEIARILEWLEGRFNEL
jgi:hypothetical protein